MKLGKHRISKLSILRILIFLLSYCAYNYTFFRIDEYSMIPTLKSGDMIFVRKNVKIKDRSYRGRIVIFKFPFSNYADTISDLLDKSELYIKRCIGAPGDSIYIKNGLIYNSFFGKVWGKDLSDSSICLMAHDYDVITNYNQNRLDNILNISPIYVPKSGDTIQINKQTIQLYKKIIRYESGCNPTLGMSYVFKENYCFMCGDNILHSIDSRHWGFVPEKFIVAMYITKLI